MSTCPTSSGRRASADPPRSGLRRATGAVYLGLGLIAVVSSGRAYAADSVASVRPQAGCVAPNSPGDDPRKTAWQIFVAINCPAGVGNGAVLSAWETWPTQEQVYVSPKAGSGRSLVSSFERFHPSVQGRLIAQHIPAAMLNPAQGTCSQTTIPNSAPPITREICEEVHLNPPAATYIEQNRLITHAGQATFVDHGGIIAFPTNAIEVKADWVKGCNDAGLHVETIGGVSYCLVAMHLSSKLIPNWLWATYEAKSDVRNPNRCNVLGCSDSFGSIPASIPPGPPGVSGRDKAVPTAALTALEATAKISREWSSYAMDGAQIDFFDNGQPTRLGNSITEQELANVPLLNASCITCHAMSSVSTSGAEGADVMFAKYGNPVGAAPPLLANYKPRDFVWSLLTAH